MSSSLRDYGIFLADRVVDGLFSLLAFTLVVALLTCIGAVYRTGRPILAPLLGWATATLLIVVGALCGLDGFIVPMLLLAAIAIGGLVMHWGRIEFPLSGRIGLLLMIPVLLIGATVPSLYWDSYSHWLLNAYYLVERGHLVQAPLAGFTSLHSTYPPSHAILIYFVSSVVGRFAENAGALINIMLTLAALIYVMEVMQRELLVVNRNARGVTWQILLPLIAFLVVLPFNPAIQWGHYGSALADPVLAVFVLLTVARWCQWLALSETSEEIVKAELRSVTITLFLLGVLCAGVKHSGWLLGLILASAGATVGVLTGLPRLRWLPPAICFLAGTFFMSALWHYYLVNWLPVPDQFSVRPLSQWRFDLLPDLISAFLADFKYHYKYYIVVFVTVVTGIASLLRGKHHNVTPLALMIRFSALALVAHIMSLFLAYLGTGFVEWEIKRAASLQRYGAQVGFATCAFGLMAVALKLLPLIPQKIMQLGAARFAFLFSPVCIVAWLCVVVPMLGGGKYFYSSRLESRFLAAAALRTLPRGNRVVVVGEEWSTNFTRFTTWVDIPASQRPVVVAYINNQIRSDLPRTRELLADWMRNSSVDSILMLNSTDLASDLGLAEDPDQVWSRKTGAWQTLHLKRISRHKLAP